jgi:hypothetical protein
MRITRAITCLMPALFLAMALHDYQCESQVAVRHIAGGITFLLYAAFLAYSIFLRRILCAILWCFKRRFMLEEYLVPTTHDAKSLAVYVGSHSPKRILYHNKIRIGFRFIDLTNPAILGLMIFTILGMVLLVCLYFSNSPINPVRIFLFLGSFLVTCLVGWAWWRISKTFFTLLRNYDEFVMKKNSAPH